MSWKKYNTDMIACIKKERTYSEDHLNDLISKYQGQDLFFKLCSYFDKCYQADLPSDEELIARHGSYLK
jgi:hypothetical protein